MWPALGATPLTPLAPAPGGCWLRRQHAAWGLHQLLPDVHLQRLQGPDPASVHVSRSRRRAHLQLGPATPGPGPRGAPAPLSGGAPAGKGQGLQRSLLLLGSLALAAAGTGRAPAVLGFLLQPPRLSGAGGRGPLPDLGGVTSSSGCPQAPPPLSSSGSQSPPSRPSRVASSSGTSGGRGEAPVRVEPSQDGQSGRGGRWRQPAGVGGYLLSRWAQCRAAQSCQRSERAAGCPGPQGSLPRPEFSWSCPDRGGHGGGGEAREGLLGPQWGPPVGRKCQGSQDTCPPRASEQEVEAAPEVGEQGEGGGRFHVRLFQIHVQVGPSQMLCPKTHWNRASSSRRTCCPSGLSRNSCLGASGLACDS